jgi:hypothetical protein
VSRRAVQWPDLLAPPSRSWLEPLFWAVVVLGQLAALSGALAPLFGGGC